ncbi:serine/threonine-protein kinase atm [Quercus suber]|uniref:Serine/threonine-protein kinase atm n=1 Tax=Quercus suber TaxID=58331 RepID=A0AAW0ITA1_QUESU
MQTVAATLFFLGRLLVTVGCSGRKSLVQIFAICMALHCSKESGWEKAAIVLQGSILCLAGISRSE